MDIKTIVQKQFTVERRDVLNSLLYAILTPTIGVTIAFLDKLIMSANLTPERLILYTAISSGLNHILRKWVQKDKLVTVQKVKKDELPKAEAVAAEANAEGQVPPALNETELVVKDTAEFYAKSGDDGDGGGDSPGEPPTDPPPIGDPTHPPKK